jgi:aminoglycoside 3-N-acetyltransferase
MVVTSDHITAALHSLNLQARPLCVHASLRSFGQVAGGADAVIDGILAAECTILVPSFSRHYVAPPDTSAMRPARNAIDYTDLRADWPGEGRVYTPDTTEIEPYLGTIPRTVVERVGRVRGHNPMNSFAALGPLAVGLVSSQNLVDVYAPLKELAAHGGAVVLMGVDLTSMTLIHLAEEVAGRMLLRRWSLGADQSVVMGAVGSCSSGFWKLEGVLAPLERRLQVGESLWRIFPAAETVALAATAIERDPSITACGDPDCARCRDMVAGGPILTNTIHHS